jgi:hypothetical protein
MAGLTVTEVRNAKPGRHADGKGLYLLVKPSGAKSWVMRVQMGGRRRLSIKRTFSPKTFRRQPC